MTPISIENINLVFIDEEGVGRSKIAAAMAINSFPGMSITGVGVRAPDSGRTKPHPAVVNTVGYRTQINIENEEVRLLEPGMITKETIGVVLNDPKHLPDFAVQQALDILLAPIADPFPKLDTSLELAATQIALYIWLLQFVLTNKIDEIGINRDETDNVVPRFLSSFQLSNEEAEYSVTQPYNLYRYNDLDRPATPQRIKFITKLGH